ncbi:putative addiction module antidote protein [Neorhizobium sp. 2083]|uniref:addiction module antidote protein n=1 Tax=Neorhizobium sp. 2083 TaxID=2817762 RepID=UPI0028658ADB|nr:addiction module antidote protein [Neorhizobium sp. 2083]MDR6815141.1 putative addiction module antidote protein [Neorhizobium sp. 2083]
MTVETKKWDIVEHLDTDERIALFLEAVFEDGDPAVIAAAIGDVARARGMSQIAKEAGLSRENLYRALSEGGNPEFATIFKVIRAIGYDLTVVPHGSAAR